MRTGLLVALLSATTILAGCASQSPVGPTQALVYPISASRPQNSALTVRVLSRDSEQPIAGAAVQSATTSATTDALGVCTLSVVVGEELEVNVSASGYEPMGASGLLGPNERWTFYLPALSTR